MPRIKTVRPLYSLRIRYLGVAVVYDVREFFFHDLQTNTDFHVRDLNNLEAVLGVVRKKFYEENNHAS